VRTGGRADGGFETRVSLFSVISEITGAAREMQELIARDNKSYHNDGA